MSEQDADLQLVRLVQQGKKQAFDLLVKKYQYKVIVLSKSELSAGSTNYAQGGIAGVYNTADDNDSVEEHIEDTKIAGGGLCDPDAVEFTLRNAKSSIAWLIEQGVPFDEKEEEQENVD